MANILLFLSFLLFFISPSHVGATTYWVAQNGGVSGTNGNCPTISGTSDPGSYMTPSGFDSANCGAGGDTIIFKAGTYTGSNVRLSNMLPSGTSTNARTQILCETHRGCTMQWGSGAAAGILEAWNVSYFQIGDTTHGFIADCVNGASNCIGIKFHLTTNAVFSDNVIQGNYVKNHHGSGINNTENQETGGYYVRFLWSYNFVEPQAAPVITGPPHPYYLAARDSIVEYNYAQTLATPQYAYHCYHICTGNTFRYNYAEVASSARGIVVSDSETGLPGNNMVYRNVFHGGSGSQCFDNLNQTDSNTFVNNVCDGFSSFVRNNSAATGNIFKNNLCSGGCLFETGTGLDPTLLVCGGTCSTTNPTVTAATHYKNPSGGDYSLKSGSSQIDAGLNVGLPFNGSAPDRGAFETILFSTCEVQSGATSTILVTFTNNVAPPLLPSTGVTGFTARKNGASNALNGTVTRTSDGVFSIPVTNSYAGGDTIDISWSSGNITDSSLNGGAPAVNQPYVGTLTNQSCTNNAGGAPSYTYTQSRYELHYYRGTEDSPVILPHGFASTGAAENFPNYKVTAPSKLRIRFAIVCGGADCPPTAFNLYRSTGGGYTALTDSFGASGGLKFCGDTPGSDMAINGQDSTNQLSTSGTFVPGGIMFTSSAIPTVTGLNNGFKTELEYCVEIRDTATGFFDLRIYQQDGTALNTYTITPHLVIVNMAAGGSGF